MGAYKLRKCRSCKEVKILNNGNFRKRANVGTRKYDYDKACRDCKRRIEDANKVKRVRKAKIHTCSEPSCSNTYTRKRVTQKFCSVECRIVFHIAKTTRTLENERASVKGGKILHIDERFLSRGKIRYEGYTTL